MLLYAVLNQCAVKLHVHASFFLLSASLQWLRLYLCLCALADVHDTKVVVGSLELSAYLEFLVCWHVNFAAREPRQCLDTIQLSACWDVEP